MATTAEYADYVCEQLRGVGTLRSKKMFGEYMIYVNEKPVVLVCDNPVFVKSVPAAAARLADAARGYPYEGAQEHCILDIDDAEGAREIVRLLESVTPLPKRKKKESAKNAQML